MPKYSLQHEDVGRALNVTLGLHRHSPSLSHDTTHIGVPVAPRAGKPSSAYITTWPILLVHTAFLPLLKPIYTAHLHLRYDVLKDAYCL